VRGPKGVPLDAVIRFGVDKAGNKYGPDNNPKKVGTKTHGRFGTLYQDGMTIQQAMDAGLPTADLVYDRDHGFIQFEGADFPSAATAAGVPAETNMSNVETDPMVEDAGTEDYHHAAA
jgi:hypothetical protein